MKIYLAGAKDTRLENGCIALCDDNFLYKRLFSFAYQGDLSTFVDSFKDDLKFMNGDINENKD